MNSKNRFILINLLAIEFILLNLVLITYLFVRLPNFSLTDPTFLYKLGVLGILYNSSWLFIILYIREKEFYFNPEYPHLKSLLISLFFFIGLITTLVILLKIHYFARSNYIGPIFVFTYLNLISHRYLFKYFKKKDANHFTEILLVGSANKFSNIKGFRNAMAKYGYKIVGQLEDKTENTKDISAPHIIGGIGDLSTVLSSRSVDEVFISTSALDQNKIAQSIKIADNFGVRVKLIPEDPLRIAKNYRPATIGRLAVFELRQSQLDNFNMTILKRLFDFCFSLLVVTLLSPVFLLIALMIRLDSKGPTFYSPTRKGEGGRTFKCHKFRTMTYNDDPLNGTKSTVLNDPRITRIGRFLRKNDLDELPQFFNVLKGDMSVIGPRPHRVNLQKDFRKSVNDYMVRSYIKPGITGWAQVNGWRGPTVTDKQKNERIRHDLWYIENWSFWLDVKIIFLTLFGGHRKKAF